MRIKNYETFVVVSGPYFRNCSVSREWHHFETRVTICEESSKRCHKFLSCFQMSVIRSGNHASFVRILVKVTSEEMKATVINFIIPVGRVSVMPDPDFIRSFPNLVCPNLFINNKFVSETRNSAK